MPRQGCRATTRFSGFGRPVVMVAAVLGCDSRCDFLVPRWRIAPRHDTSTQVRDPTAIIRLEERHCETGRSTLAQFCGSKNLLRRGHSFPISQHGPSESQLAPALSQRNRNSSPTRRITAAG
jgi:hypothetical protein